MRIAPIIYCCLFLYSCIVNEVNQNEVYQEVAIGHTFRIPINETIRIQPDDLLLSFLDVPNESRCPREIWCIWQGYAIAQFFLYINSPDTVYLDFDVPGMKYSNANVIQDTLGYRINLIQLDPYPDWQDTVWIKSNYNALMMISRISAIPQTSDYTSYFYLTDSLGNETTTFVVNEEIFFHFGIINHTDSPLEYALAHGGPPFYFNILVGDSIVGRSDDGYFYTAVVLPGTIAAHDTLQHSTSWYSNEYHDGILTSGQYKTTSRSYIYLDDITPSTLLDTIAFEIKPI